MLRQGRLFLNWKIGRTFTGAVGILTVLSASRLASAHFILQSPPSWMSQSNLGDPQKLGPCGDEAGGTLTNTVTSFAPGETITITINEVVFHPGHYRIALATTRGELPDEPLVTAGSTPCGSVPIQSPPVFPVLADGVWQHNSAFSAPQSVQVTLPSTITCTKCTLQIIEFMSNHGLNNPGGCFYHHCADISIQARTGTGGSTSVGGTSALGAGGTGPVAIGGRSPVATGGALAGSGGTPQTGGATEIATGGTLAATGGASTPMTGGAPMSNGGSTSFSSSAVSNSGGTSTLSAGGTVSAFGGAFASSTPGPSSTDVDGKGDPSGGSQSGCACSIVGSSRGGLVFPGIALALLGLLRQRRAVRRPH